MKAMVAINPKFKHKIKHMNLGSTKFGETTINFGLVDLPKPKFDNKSKDNSNFVLVKINAISCNFRDKGILLGNYEKLIASDQLYLPFGSEFSGIVVDYGTNVNCFSINQSVIPDCSYPKENNNIRPGIPTNFASLGWLRIHKDKLLNAPRELTDSEAACFSLGAQTAHSMIRRSNILQSPDPKPLIFSAKSATSLFIIKELLAHGIKPTCLSTSKWNQKELKSILGAEVRNDYSCFEKDHTFFTHVFDPFFDVNIEKAVNLLSIYGTYITCGLNSQHPSLSNSKLDELECNLRSSILGAIVKDISIIGNCLGIKSDLEEPIAMLESKIDLKPILDSEYSLSDGLKFIEKSFFDSSKFGKCVLRYDTSYDT